MKALNLTWSKDAFKNFFALFTISCLFWMMYNDKEFRETGFVVVMLVIKHYFDSNASSAKKDATIASMANSIPDAPKEEKV